MSTNNTNNTGLSDLSRVSEQIENSSGIDWDRALQEVREFIHSFEGKHTTEIVNEIKKISFAGFGLFDILKNLGKIDEDKTRLIESIPAYAPYPETNMYYYATTDGCIVNSRTLQVTELDDSFWEYLKFFIQEIRYEGNFLVSTPYFEF